MIRIAPDGIRNTAYHGKCARIQPPTASARKYPLEIMMPKIPPNTPLSRTWNHAEFTLTTESAPKLWKYMLSE